MFEQKKFELVKKWLVHTRCGGVVSKKTLLCDRCGKKPPNNKVELRRKGNKIYSHRRSSLRAGMVFYEESLFRYPRQ